VPRTRGWAPSRRAGAPWRSFPASLGAALTRPLGPARSRGRALPLLTLFPGFTLRRRSAGGKGGRGRTRSVAAGRYLLPRHPRPPTGHDARRPAPGARAARRRRPRPDHPARPPARPRHPPRPVPRRGGAIAGKGRRGPACAGIGFRLRGPGRRAPATSSPGWCRDEARFVASIAGARRLWTPRTAPSARPAPCAFCGPPYPPTAPPLPPRHGGRRGPTLLSYPFPR